MLLKLVAAWQDDLSADALTGVSFSRWKHCLPVAVWDPCHLRQMVFQWHCWLPWMACAKFASWQCC